MAARGDVISGGAFVGDFLPALSRALVPGALLHSFEPNPDAYENALYTIALNSLENVCLAQAAVGDVCATQPLQIDKKPGKALEGSARLIPKHGDALTVDVEVTRLDDLVPQDRPVWVLHLDVEGHEVPALRGAIALIRRWRPFLAIEAQNPGMRQITLRFVQRHLQDMGYRLLGDLNATSFCPRSGNDGLTVCLHPLTSVPG